MASYKVEQVPGPLTLLGEGPHWDIERQSLYYIDILGATVHRYDYAENKTYNANVDNVTVISFIVPVKGSDDQFVIGTGPKLTLISWDGKAPKAKLVKVLAELGENEKNNRFNDGKVDPFGRLYAGTMRSEEHGDIFEVADGTLYRYDAKASKYVGLKKDICIANGLTWNEKTNKFYYIDSRELDIKEFDYSEKGDISNEKVLIDFTVGGKKPAFVADGMTSDADGFLYVATFGGSKILKINPKTKTIDLEIKIPAEQITSAAFGGPKLDILYLTTAGKEFKTPQKAPAGAVFKVTGLGVVGKPMNKMDLTA